MMSSDKLETLYPHFHKTLGTKLGALVTYVEGVLLTNSHVLCLVGPVVSSHKIKMLYLHFHKTCKHQTWRRGNLG